MVTIFNLKRFIILLPLLVACLPISASGQIAVADVDSVALSTSDTTIVYTASTMWRDVLLTARGCNVCYKPAFTIADTTEWDSMSYAIIPAGATIGIAKDYDNPSIVGLRAIRVRALTGTGALIMMGARKEY